MNTITISPVKRLILRRTFGFALVIVLMAGSALAQGRGRRRLSAEEQQKRFEQQTQGMVKALELTSDQKPLFVAILEAENADRTDIFEDIRAGGDRSGIREKMAELNDRTEAALADVLTEDQFEKYKKIMSARRTRRGPTQS